MATQTKNDEIVITPPQYAFKDDEQPRPDGKERTAWDQIGHLFGKYKDDLYVREVLDRVVARRHKGRIEDIEETEE